MRYRENGKEEWKAAVIKAADQLREEILAMGEEIYKHPETDIENFIQRNWLQIN